MFERDFARPMGDSAAHLKLGSGSRVAVVGGGPAGSFFSYFLLDMTYRAGMDVEVDIYESRDFSSPGPVGCNMCGGIISESLVQALSMEGISLPPTVVQRGIDSYVLHTHEGSIRIETPLHEKRIAAVHRGSGPRDIRERKWRSFDGYLQQLAQSKGAHVVRGRVDAAGWNEGRPQVKIKGGEFQTYDLLVVAVGVNSPAMKLFEELAPRFKPPQATKAYIREYCLGQERVEAYLGNSMHVFLLSLPRLEFAALIPKGDYVTLCLLGKDIDGPLVQSFLDTPEVKQCLPADWETPKDYCHCSPRISVHGAVEPFADRLVFIGDCGVTRLYKDGIGAAYRTSKAAAVAAAFQGISAQDFRQHYWPTCRTVGDDNAIGKFVFAVTHLIQKLPFARRGVLRMIAREQQARDTRRRMSMALWDLFTGSAPYREVLLRTVHPAFWSRFLWEMAAGLMVSSRRRTSKAADTDVSQPMGRPG